MAREPKESSIDELARGLARAPALLRVYRMAVPAAPPVTVVADRSASMAPV
jgi:hypothetical protein